MHTGELAGAQQAGEQEEESGLATISAEGAASTSSSNPPAPSGKKASHSNLYLRGLPLDITEERLLALVSPYGVVQSLRIYHAQKNLSLGTKNQPCFSFVKFSTVQEAQAAIAALDGAEYAGQLLQARPAVRDVDSTSVATAAPKSPASDNIYCKNLPSSLRDNELRGVFSAYGTVVSCRILRQGNATGLGGAALVRFASVEEAAAAVEALQGSRFPGSLHPLIIRFADSEEVKERKHAERLGMGGDGDKGLDRDMLQEQGTGSVSGQGQQQGRGRAEQRQAGAGPDAGGRHASRQQQQRDTLATAPRQPAYNPYTALDTRPGDAAAAGFASSGMAPMPSASSRYPVDPFRGWHPTAMYLPHGQLMMMAEAPSSAAPGPSYSSSHSNAGAKQADLATATARAAAGAGLGSGGTVPGVGAGLVYPPLSEAGLPGHYGLDSTDPAAGAAGGFQVRYAPVVHPGYMHLPQMPLQMPVGGVPAPGSYFPQGTPTMRPPWVVQAGGGASSSAAPSAAAIPSPDPLPAHALHTVYCSNLPDHADRLYLYECFAPFGAILSVKVLKDKKGQSRRAAFINYAEAVGAARAVAAMNNLPVGSNRHLHVSLRNPT